MGIDNLRSAMPDYARDIRLNLGSVISAPRLDPAMAWGSALTAALVSKNAQVIQNITEDAQAVMDDQHIKAAKSAAAMMSMTNVWYKFTDLIRDNEIKNQPPKLRMNCRADPRRCRSRIVRSVEPRGECGKCVWYLRKRTRIAIEQTGH